MSANKVIIPNPILNFPYEEPTRHFRFTDEGITNEVLEGRRSSTYFVPIPQSKMKSKQQLRLDHPDMAQERTEENVFINRVRERVGIWRQGGYQGVTKTTQRLLQHWQNPERERRLFFCQREAVETMIYIVEAARRFSDDWISEALTLQNEGANPGLFRLAAKMATGSGKTAVMAMLIAWQSLNKLANPLDNRFTDAFLIVTPGITVRDRLRVLLPSELDNYYQVLDLAPIDLVAQLGQAKIVITNFHAFLRREQVEAAALTKAILRRGKEGESPFTETPAQMVRRVCRDLGNKRQIVVLNDEAHHCYRRKPANNTAEKLTADERAEAKRFDEEARIWISGLEAIAAERGIKAIYDLSATPFFLSGSGYPEGTLFPWVVSDFSLIDAIEAGLVKVPRVPVADNAVIADDPTYRTLWPHIRDDLPKRGRGAQAATGEPKLPKELEGALQSLYGHYERVFRRWEADADAHLTGQTPPVFIVVCNNTNVSKLVYDHIAGWERPLPDGTSAIMSGRLPLFSNERDGCWVARPHTILIDSEQLESGEGMSDDFKKIAATEIAEFKADYRRRYPGRDVEAITDEELLREVLNTVGKSGKLGERVRCVVSVSMLTEGWDANTVTHILGVRAFRTRLLCEQVVGRALRRMSYAVNDEGKFEPEYADVYGVPFSFIPDDGTPVGTPRVALLPTRVRALEDRRKSEIEFPRLVGYHYDLADRPIKYTFTPTAKLSISTRDVPTKVQVDPIVGQGSVHTLDDLRGRRVQEVAFGLARRALENHFRDSEGTVKHWYFPQLLEVARAWLRECLVLQDNTFPQLLLLAELSHTAAERIYGAIVEAEADERILAPILRPYDWLGSTRYVDFDTTKPVYPTAPDRCHVSHVVADTKLWEQKMAQTLEEMDEVISYVKNQGLGFAIPYTFEGEERQYLPDFLIHARDGQPDLLNLIVEVSGFPKPDKQAKVDTARNFWIRAVNNAGRFGRWGFLEVTDPWDALGPIRAALAGQHAGSTLWHNA